jgi:hypothetical protein
MATQFIVNDKGEKTAVLVPISDEYKTMIDHMLEKEPAEYINLKAIEDKFKNK